MSRRWIAGIAAALLLIVGLVVGITIIGIRAQAERFSPAGAVLPTVSVRPTALPATALPAPSAAAQTVPVAAQATAAPSARAATPAPAVLPATAQVPATAAPAQPPAALRPSRATASGTAPPSRDDRGVQTTYDATNAIDGDLTTAWRVPGSGVNQTLTLTFDAPVRVSSIKLVPGYAKIDERTRTDRFMQNRRVVRVRFEFSSGDAVEGQYVEQPVLQTTAISDVLTTFVRIVILETTPPGRNDGRDFTPISEVVVSSTAQ